MKKLATAVFIIGSAGLLLYLVLPNQPFPAVDNASLRSSEPGDVESDLRRGYYNNSNRQETISLFRSKFNQLSIFGKKLNYFSFTLNYPSEEAQTLIRDQTRSTYLEEIVHPMRESLFVNGFEPKKDSDVIFVNGQSYLQKNIIKLVNSTLFFRLLLGIFALLSIFLITKAWTSYYQEFKTSLLK